MNGATVRALREALGVKNADLSARVGITPGTLSHVEAGARQVSPSVQVAIATALGVPLEAITYPVAVAA